MEQFDKNVCRAILKDMEEALEDVCKKYGMEIRTNGGKLTHETFSPRIEFILEGGKTKKESRVEQDLERYAPDLIGKSYRGSGGALFTIYGFDTKKRQYPILSKRSDGRLFKCAEDHARHAVARYDEELAVTKRVCSSTKPKSRRVS